ncbi:hypothetical protein PUN28_014777 [Cardiocondyla obscurior]|uniref:Uncharacterized protein n=1 Tax=Cardiocondyla obscurior TaxID=286306 RepID=A0AAW2F0C9_9HYME
MRLARLAALIGTITLLIAFETLFIYAACKTAKKHDLQDQSNARSTTINSSFTIDDWTTTISSTTEDYIKNICTSKSDISNYTYVLKDPEKETLCVLGNVTIGIFLQEAFIYNSSNDQPTLTVPSDAITTGKCGKKNFTITLSWKEVASEIEKNNTITFNCTYNTSMFTINYIAVDVYWNEMEIKNEKNSCLSLCFADCDLPQPNKIVHKRETAQNVGTSIDIVVSDILLILCNEETEAVKLLGSNYFLPTRQDGSSLDQPTVFSSLEETYAKMMRKTRIFRDSDLIISDICGTAVPPSPGNSAVFYRHSGYLSELSCGGGGFERPTVNVQYVGTSSWIDGDS